ncbi:DUF7674 family protein [Pseudoduganella sp. S-14]|uniref:DUF7674 family protein n=1 Tax=Pseudoduganella sp. S-14 TaxID=3404065 RepID=UPI003CF2F127
MSPRNANTSLVAALRSRFQTEAALTDDWLRERGWDPADDDTALNWVEAFAERTTEAVRRRDAEAVRAHTNFIAAAYRAEPAELRTIVDVSYAENLMWDSSVEDKKWAWIFIAAEIRQLFTEMWGDPTID